ncbi:hypothetical protein EXIGLDRAFT_727081 [Exidia glandulosa HHB12029]|uniref:Uncharacterized protein n=1 Tax=Exidia glandulosa HHB12029 TaxID=1314781 RepID=A0A165M4J7_EXIGL|nr:hypothetical protein EXIGLDRAFT_727081 [Exidia glandulosa HHB12029]
MPAIASVNGPPSAHNKRIDTVQTHISTLNASVEGLSSRLTSTTAEIGEAKREIQALAATQGDAQQQVLNEVKLVVKRAQAAVVEAVGVPAQAQSVKDLAASSRIVEAKLDALTASVAAIQKSVDARDRIIDAKLGALDCKIHLIQDSVSRLAPIVTKQDEITNSLSVALATLVNNLTTSSSVASSSTARKRTRHSTSTERDVSSDSPLFKRARASDRASATADPSDTATTLVSSSVVPSSIPAGAIPGTYESSSATGSPSRSKRASPHPASDASLYVPLSSPHRAKDASTMSRPVLPSRRATHHQTSSTLASTRACSELTTLAPSSTSARGSDHDALLPLAPAPVIIAVTRKSSITLRSHSSNLRAQGASDNPQSSQVPEPNSKLLSSAPPIEDDVPEDDELACM